MIANSLVVAGGNNGNVIAVPVDEDGLGQPKAIDLAPWAVQRSSSLGGGVGVPYVFFVVPLGELAIPEPPATCLEGRGPKGVATC
jgi:hypothetical protein